MNQTIKYGLWICVTCGKSFTTNDEYFSHKSTHKTESGLDKVKNCFKEYPDIKVDEFKFLIEDLADLFAKERQALLEEIKKELTDRYYDEMFGTWGNVDINEVFNILNSKGTE